MRADAKEDGKSPEESASGRRAQAIYGCLDEEGQAPKKVKFDGALKTKTTADAVDAAEESRWSWWCCSCSFEDVTAYLGFLTCQRSCTRRKVRLSVL